MCRKLMDFVGEMGTLHYIDLICLKRRKKNIDFVCVGSRCYGCTESVKMDNEPLGNVLTAFDVSMSVKYKT